VPLLTGDPLTTVHRFVHDSTEREELEELTDAELLRQAAREVAIAICMVANAMIRQAAVMATRPAEAGFLAHALAKCFQAATASFGQARNASSG
jgi:hypothetical protein